VLCLSNAALMIAVGLLGEYVGRIYEEGKDRPLYVIADTWNLRQPGDRQEDGHQQASVPAGESKTHLDVAARR